VCLALERKDREILLHGYETGRIVRLPGGEYVEVHGHVDDHERYRLAGPEQAHPFEARPRPDGRLRLTDRLRARASRFFFEDRLAPLPAEQPGVGAGPRPDASIGPDGGASAQEAGRAVVGAHM
jgi:ubiquinol-cytochrome c reductase cytochrome b subunit